MGNMLKLVLAVGFALEQTFSVAIFAVFRCKILTRHYKSLS
jgi:hypothetical protein